MHTCMRVCVCVRPCNFLGSPILTIKLFNSVAHA